MRKYLYFVLALMIFSIIHEGIHAFLALVFKEYQTVVIHPYGLEVIYKTSVTAREGMKWAFISGLPNVATLALGYSLFLNRMQTTYIQKSLAHVLLYVTVLLMLGDAFNLSVGPFIYGGDINGISKGFGVNRYIIQSIFFIVLLLNRELLVQKLLPVYGIKTKHPLFYSWKNLKQDK